MEIHILKLNAKLAEGLFWDANSELLYGVDIEQPSIWRTSIGFSSSDSIRCVAKVGWCIRIDDSDLFLVGSMEGISFMDSLLNFSSQILCLGVLARNQRFNDAKADILGNIWGGVMDDSEHPGPNGFLFKLSPDGVIFKIDDGYYIPNGPAFSPDSSYMLHTDSWLRTIYIYDFDSKLGLIKNKRIWKNFPIEDGSPDGMCFDSQGCVWIAHWGCGKVCRYDVDGSLMATYHFPASHVSNVCFGGGDLSRLFVSSATAGLDSNQIAQQELAGSVFEISNVGVVGLPPFLAGVSFVNLLNEN
jgi:D-xylonolactonase